MKKLFLTFFLLIPIITGFTQTQTYDVLAFPNGDNMFDITLHNLLHFDEMSYSTFDQVMKDHKYILQKDGYVFDGGGRNNSAWNIIRKNANGIDMIWVYDTPLLSLKDDLQKYYYNSTSSYTTYHLSYNGINYEIKLTENSLIMQRK